MLFNFGFDGFQIKFLAFRTDGIIAYILLDKKDFIKAVFKYFCFLFFFAMFTVLYILNIILLGEFITQILGSKKDFFSLHLCRIL